MLRHINKGKIYFPNRDFNMEENTPIIWSPEQPKATPPPPPQYELKTDVTGEAPPIRGAIFIEILVPDKKNGGRMKVKAQVPRLPKANCKLCYGKGYVGFETKSEKVIFCHKCFGKK